MAYVCVCFRCAELLERYPREKKKPLMVPPASDSGEPSDWNRRMVQEYCNLKRDILTEHSDRLSDIMAQLSKT
eukprot:1185774-Prorocentrum_minimum.AAC.3